MASSTRISGLSGLASWVLLASLPPGCGPATNGDPEFWAPSNGGGGAPPGPGASSAASAGAGVGGSGGGEGPSPSGGLALRFTTVSVDGEYAPDNVGAVWITDDQDVFVKTLEIWGAKRAKHLVKWVAASEKNVVDAVTGATRSSHVAHESSWDSTDTAGLAVPEGAYRVYVEFTESNSAERDAPGPWMAVDFAVGPGPQDLILPDLPAFRSIHLTYAR